jgi:hypothetical protein
MPDNPRSPQQFGNDGLAAFAIGVLAIGCCAGPALIAALAGGVAAGTLLGIGAAPIGVVALIGLIALVVRARRHACEPGASRHTFPTARRR